MMTPCERISYALRRSSSMIFRFALVALFGALGTESASAHVKWFCAYNVAGQPEGLENVLCQDFDILVFVALVWLFAGCLIEKTSGGGAGGRAGGRGASGGRGGAEGGGR